MNAQDAYIVVPAHIARGADTLDSEDEARLRAEQLVAKDRTPRVVLKVISTFDPTRQVRVAEQRFAGGE